MSSPAFPLPDTGGSEIPEAVLDKLFDTMGAGSNVASELLPDVPVDEPVVEDALAEAPGFIAEDEPVEELEGDADGKSDDLPPIPPGGPIFRDDDPAAPPTYTQEQLDERVEAELQRRLNAYQVQQQSTPPPVPAAPQLPPLPQLSREDMEEIENSPALRALFILANNQQARINEANTLAQQASQGQQQRQLQEIRGIADTAASEFKSRYNIPDDVMAKVRAQSSAETPYLMSRMQAGADQFAAFTETYERAYWNTPEARQYEFERQANARVKSATRKAKLGGVGGSSGSAHRQPVVHDESTSEGRYNAAVDFVRAAREGVNDQ
jgi:hypothetical protein